MRIRTLGIAALAATLVAFGLASVDGQIIGDPPPEGNGKCSADFDCTTITECATAPLGSTCFDEINEQVVAYTASKTVKVTQVQKCQDGDGDNCKIKAAEDVLCAREQYYTFKQGEPEPDCGTLVCTKLVHYETSCTPLDD